MQTEAPAKKRQRCQGGQRLFASHPLDPTWSSCGLPGAGFRRVSGNCGEPHRKMRDKTMVFYGAFTLTPSTQGFWQEDFIPNTKSTHAKPGATPSRPTWTILTALVPCESAHGTKSSRNGAGFALVVNVAQQECR